MLNDLLYLTSTAVQDNRQTQTTLIAFIVKEFLI